jgi:hypothetical protein
MILLLGLLALSAPAPTEHGALVVRAGFEGVSPVEHPEGSGEWGPAKERSWSKTSSTGATLRVVEVVPARPPTSLKGYLGRWRAGHGCTAKELRLPQLGLGPELNFEGSCKGGDLYAIKVLLVKGRVYELHADRRVGAPATDLRAALQTFAATIALSDEHTRD